MTTLASNIGYSGKHIAAFSALLALWLAAAYFIGAEHLLTNTGARLIAPIAITAAVPVAGFVVLYAVWTRFRQFILGQSIETLTMLQHWRIIGFAFLPLYFYDALPGFFAWPAGVGDIAIGLAAPFVVARLRSDAEFATSSGLLRFHYLGLLDFVVAIAAAGLSAGAFPALVPSGVTSAGMDVWPLNLFPSFIVPVFIILHLSVLLKVRELRRGATQRLHAAPRTA
jgi:hypothetical protein